MSWWLLVPAGVAVLVAWWRWRQVRRRRLERLRVPGLRVDGTPLSAVEAREFAWLKLMYHQGAEAPEAVYGERKTDGEKP